MTKLNRLALLVTLGCITSFSVEARLYKWVDDKGVTHYGEVIPAEYANKNRSQLSAEGRVVSTEEVLTPEQARAKQEQLKRKQLEEEAQGEQKRRDSALLGTFSNVAEIDAAKARSIQQIDSTISSILVQIKINQNKLDALLSEERSFKLNHAAVPGSLSEDLKDTQSRLNKRRAELDKFKQERASVEARFEADKARYRLLTGAAHK